MPALSQAASGEHVWFGAEWGGDDFAVSTLLSRTLKSFLSGLSGFHS